MATAELLFEPHTHTSTIPLLQDWNVPRRWAEWSLRVGFGIGLVLADVLVVLGAFILMYWLRFMDPGERLFALAPDAYVFMALGVGLATCCLLAVHGMYDQEHVQRWLKQLRSIVSAVSTALVLVLAASFVVRTDPYSRLWFVGGWALTVIGLVAWRAMARRLYVKFRDALALENRVLIVGANALGAQLERELADGYHVVGYVDNGTDFACPTVAPLLGPISELEHLVNRHAVDEIVMALPAGRRQQVSALLQRGFQRRVKVKLLPDLSDVLPHHAQVEHVGGRSFIGFGSAAKVTWLKRVLDLAVVYLSLVALAPVLGLIALLVKLDSPGPILYRQERVGKNGRRFHIIKFRSMRQDADQLLAALRAQNEATGPLFKMRNDPRVTRVGRVLRRLSLDELPQVFNVLKGEMSLVGPRPPLPSEVGKYEDWQLGRLRAVPGITGLWQVSGRSEVPFHDMVRLDLHYIRNWSFTLDLDILLRTIPAVLASRGAY